MIGIGGVGRRRAWGIVLGLMVLGSAGAWAWRSYDRPARLWREAVLDDDDGQRRWDAVYRAVSGRAGVDVAAALGTLVDAVDHPSYRIRQTAVMGLGKFGPRSRSHVRLVVAALSDPDLWVRGSAAWALGEIVGERPPVPVRAGDDPARTEALPALVAALGDRSIHVRLAAAKSLGKLGAGRAAVPVLAVGLGPRHGVHRFESLEALRAIGSPDARAAAPAMIAMAADSEALEASDDLRLKMGRVYVAETLFRLEMVDDALAILHRAERSGDRLVSLEARRLRSRLVEVRREPRPRVVSVLAPSL